jgi:ATP-dependent Lon protease
VEDRKNSILTTGLKVTGTVVAILVALWGFFWKFDSTYARSTDVDSLRIQTVETFKGLQEQMEKRDKSYFLQQQIFDLNRKLNFLIERKYNLRDLIRKYPDDQDLKNEYEEVKESIKIVEEQLQKFKNESLLIE